MTKINAIRTRKTVAIRKRSEARNTNSESGVTTATPV